jgi:hypothetical protein
MIKLDFHVPSKPNVPFTRKDVQEYLDDSIRYHRDKLVGVAGDLFASHRTAIDTLQSVRLSLFGALLP